MHSSPRVGSTGEVLPRSRPRVQRRVPPWVKSVLFAVLGVYAFYLLAANLVLRTSLLRGWLRSDEGALVVDYASARSLYPGHVVVHGLDVRFENDDVQMSIDLERAELDIVLWRLARHTARFENVRAEGLVYRLRTKVDGKDANAPRVAAFPPIGSFTDPPLRRPPRPRKGGKQWTIEVRELGASVREVWTMEYRFRGDAYLEGGFHIAPGADVWVGPAVMRSRTGAILFRDQEFLRGDDWELHAQIDPYRPSETRGADVLRHMSFALRQHGDVVALDGLAATYLDDDMKLEGGAGPFAVDVHVDHGRVQPDAKVTYRTGAATMRIPKLAVTGDVDTQIRIAEDRPHVVAEAKTALARLSTATTLRGVHGVVELEGVDTAAPIALERVIGSVEAAHVADLRAWQPWVGSALALRGGAVTTTARAEYAGGGLTGAVSTHFERASLAVGPFAVVASGDSSAGLASKDLARELHFPGARADLNDIAITLREGHAEHLWLRARTDDARAATNGAGRGHASFAVVSGPGEEATRFFTRMASLPDLAADIVHGRQLEATLRLDVRDRDLTLDVTGAKNGLVEGRGRLLKSHGRPAAGAFLIAAGGVTAGLEMGRGTISVRPLAGGEWLDQRIEALAP